MIVELFIETNEEVTPELLAVKVAIALAKENAIREGERVFVKAENHGLDGNRYCNSFVHDGWQLTDLGGILKQMINYPQIRSEINDDY